MAGRVVEDRVGFTLVEVLVALLLLAVVAGIGFSVHTAAIRAARSGAAAAEASRRGIMALNCLADDLANLVAGPAAEADRPLFAAGPPRPADAPGRVAAGEVYSISFTGRAVAGLDPWPPGAPLAIRYAVVRNDGGDSFRLVRQVAGRAAVTLVPEMADYAFSFTSAEGELFPRWPPDDTGGSLAPSGNGTGRDGEEGAESAGLPVTLAIDLVVVRQGERYPFRTAVPVGGGW